MSEKPSRGRPSKGDEAKRFPLSIRTTRELKERLEAAATVAGRSLAQEIETRLAVSLEEKGPMPSEATAALLRSITTAIGIIEGEDGCAWFDNLETFTAVEAAIAQLVDRRKPDYAADDLPRLAALRSRYEVEMKVYNHALAEYEAQHPDHPQEPPVRREWLAEDRRFSQAASRGDRVAERITPRPRCHHMLYASEG